METPQVTLAEQARDLLWKTYIWKRSETWTNATFILPLTTIFVRGCYSQSIADLLRVSLRLAANESAGVPWVLCAPQT